MKIKNQQSSDLHFPPSLPMIKGVEWEIDGVTLLGLLLVIISVILGVIVGIYGDPKTDNLNGLKVISAGIYLLGFLLIAATVRGPRRRKEER